MHERVQVQREISVARLVEVGAGAIGGARRHEPGGSFSSHTEWRWEEHLRNRSVLLLLQRIAEARVGLRRARLWNCLRRFFSASY